MKQALRGAYSHLTSRLLLSQWVGNLLLLLLAGAWLQIPDSHTWQFAFSVLSGALLVVIFLVLYTATFRHLRPCAAPPAWWYSWLVLAGFLVVWWLGLECIAWVRAHESLYAGYLNSQSSAALRRHLGYAAIVAWQERILDAVQWLWAGLLLPMAVVHCASGFHNGSLRHGAQPYRHWLYWFAVFLCGFAGSAVTWQLAYWVPATGLFGQSLSVAIRLGIAYTIDILLWCFVLALAAHYLDHVETNQSGL
jgi:hypothetical protein